MVDLIPRFHDVDSGEILLDGINIKEFALNSLRQQMGIVSQEPILFNESIAHNIMLGASQENLEAMKKAAVMANASGFIEQKKGNMNIKLATGAIN